MSLDQLKHLATELASKENRDSEKILPSAHIFQCTEVTVCLLYTSDAADE